MDEHIQYANFSEASREGHIVILKRCTRKDTNKLDADGMTPVHWAAFYGKIEALRILIGKGGNPDKTNSQGCTSVHLSACAGQLHCLVFLTNYGCNVYAINDNGASPMQEAVNNGRLDCVRHIEALVTHQVSQDKAKVEKMQTTAKKEAERRMKEKHKLLLKMDRGFDKRTKHKLMATHLTSGEEFSTGSKHAFSQLTRFPPSDGGSFECESGLSTLDDETSTSESYKRSESDNLNENSAEDVLYNLDLSKGRKSDEASETTESSKLDKNIAIPSKSSSLMASLRSLHSNDAFISSGAFTNVSLQGCQGPLLTLKNGKVINSSFDESNVSASLPPQPMRARTIGNVPPSKRVGKPIGLVDISMGPLYTLLHSLQLDEFREVFLREKIDLRACLLCNESDLREIGLPVGPRKKFLDATSKRNRILISTNEMIDSAV